MPANDTIKRPAEIEAVIKKLKDKVKNEKSEKHPGVNKVTCREGDWVLIHNGVRVIVFRAGDPFEEISTPAANVVFWGTQQQCEQEIRRLNLGG